MDALLVKAIDNSLRPVTAIDADAIAMLKVGQPVQVKVTRKAPRSLPHHRLFFGGLLPLAFEYWQPTGGLVSDSERDVVQWVAKRLDILSGGSGVVLDAVDEALKLLAKGRAQKITPIQKDMDAFRRWLTIEAGWFEVYETPGGIRKEPMSISFKNMEQEQFNAFYKSCFDVCWNMLLQHKFASEEEAQAAVETMMQLGN